MNGNKKPIVSIKKTVNFGKYQKTKTKLQMIKLLSEHDFNNTPQYKTILVKELDKSVRHLDQLLKEVK